LQVLTHQPQAHEGAMERTARRFLDCVTRDKTLSRDRGLSLSDEQQRGLVPLHLLSMGEFAAIVV